MGDTLMEFAGEFREVKPDKKPSKFKRAWHWLWSWIAALPVIGEGE